MATANNDNVSVSISDEELDPAAKAFELLNLSGDASNNYIANDTDVFDNSDVDNGQLEDNAPLHAFLQLAAPPTLPKAAARTERSPNRLRRSIVATKAPLKIARKIRSKIKSLLDRPSIKM